MLHHVTFDLNPFVAATNFNIGEVNAFVVSYSFNTSHWSRIWRQGRGLLLCAMILFGVSPVWLCVFLERIHLLTKTSQALRRPARTPQNCRVHAKPRRRTPQSRWESVTHPWHKTGKMWLTREVATVFSSRPVRIPYVDLGGLHFTRIDLIEGLCLCLSYVLTVTTSSTMSTPDELAPSRPRRSI